MMNIGDNLLASNSRQLQAAAIVLALICSAAFTTGCNHMGNVPGNEMGSAPINNSETIEYKKAIVRCYKTGGSRVVKIMGKLQCY